MGRSLTPEERDLAEELGAGVGRLVKLHRDDPRQAAETIEAMEPHTRGALLLAAVIMLSEVI